MLDHEPIFGKNVIETLSEGMYDNPLFLFREYVQNAADAIDAAVRSGILHEGEGQIAIAIDADKRLIVFEDNGTGIAAADFKAMLANIGNSIKDRNTDKGFRGIGRLGGLGYCQKVRFETSLKGESIKSFMEWDARNLHDILANPNEKISAGQLIKRITSTWEEPCDVDSHFFKVSLANIKTENDDLLDVADVRRYLSMVAPVPFDYERFRFVADIEDFIKKNNLPTPHEYNLFLNNQEIRKGYATPLVIERTGKTVDILAVECALLKKDEKIIGWYWYCVSEFDGVLPVSCWQRGFRLRKANIQIGEYDCLANHPRHGQKLWREDRGNNYFLGEVHALDEGLVPNSRRDYFNQDAICRRFETVLCDAFRNLHDLYHDASAARSAREKIHAAAKVQADFIAKEKSGTFYNAKERELERQKVGDAQKKAQEAQRVIAKLQEKAEGGLIPSANSVPLAKVVEVYRPDTTLTKSKPFVPDVCPKRGFVKDNLNKGERRILDMVFKVLEGKLPPDEIVPIRDEILRRAARL